MIRFSSLLLLATASGAADTCHSQVNEFKCEQDAGCFWCTLNKGASYTCYNQAEASILSGASCSKPVPKGPTPPPPPAPTPPVPTPAPAPTPAPGPCFKYPVKSGDNCYALESYYGTKNITTLAHGTCESGQLSIGEELEICGCTYHCKDHPAPASKTCVNHTIVAGDDCVDIAAYFGSDIADMTCVSRVTNGTRGACPQGPYCGAVKLWIDDIVQICNCHEHCDETSPPTPAPVPTPVSSTCVNHTVKAGDSCADIAYYYESQLPYIKCESRIGKACPKDFDCNNKATDELFIGDVVQVCDCHQHCDETMPPTPAPPPPPTPAPKDCSKTGSMTKCATLDPEAYCGVSTEKAAVWTDGTGCSCDFGYVFDAKPKEHCEKKA